MDVRKLLLLAGALVVAVLTATMARSMFGGAVAPEPALAAPVAVPLGTEVLVATRPLPVGTILGPDSVRYQPWPKQLIDNAYFVRGQGPDAARLVGTVVRAEITAGQPLTQGSIVQPGDRGFLAAALGPGMRAVALPVSANTGVAGFVFPGDRIDLVLTQDVPGGGDGAPLKVSETMVRNLRVLATDQRTEKEVDADGRSTAKAVSTITVEATPRIAEKIAVAQSMGTLSVSLRSLADSPAELERAIAAGEVSVPADAKSEKQMMLAIAAMPQDGNTTYTLGADVSRFQRGSVPARPQGMGAPAAMAAPAVAPAGPPRPAGVRVARGNSVSDATGGN